MVFSSRQCNQSECSCFRGDREFGVGSLRGVSTGVFPFIDLGGQIWDAICSSSSGVADRGAGSFRLRSLFFCQTFLLTCRARILEGYGTTA